MFLKSFAFRLTLLLVIAVSIPTIAIEYLIVRSMTETAKLTAIRRVGQVAKFKRDLLLLRLRSQSARAHEFLMTVHTTCERGARVNPKCASQLLATYMKVEKIEAADVRHPNGLHLQAGSDTESLLERPAFREGQLAQFNRLNANKPYYLLEAKGPEAGALITVRYDLQFINDMFADVADEVGERGETFLADHEGFFITPPRYDAHSGVSHPIEASPMKACLAGKKGEMLADDYRPSQVIHGFQPIPEIGGGCIMAHATPQDAFQPIMALTDRIHTLGLLIALAAAVAAMLISRIYAKSFTNPMARLVERVEMAEKGDLESPVPTEGPAEVAALGRGFKSLLEAHRKSLDVREDFVAIVSHDLKNPINALALGISVMEIIASRLTNGAGAELLKQIAPMRKSVQRMVELIDNIFDLTAIKSGHFKVELTTQDPRPLINELVEAFQPLAEKKKVRLNVELCEQRTFAAFDHHRIYQTLSNLLGNALRFTPEDGSITIQLKTQGNDLCFGVIDSGPGVPADQRARVFDRYYQVERKGRGVGAGLGLYISREIIIAHHGKIWVESPESGPGAAFYFTLPIVPAPVAHFDSHSSLNS